MAWTFDHDRKYIGCPFLAGKVESLFGSGKSVREQNHPDCTTPPLPLLARHERILFSFSVIATEGNARRGAICMPRGTIRTPAFMPVGTGGTVKTMYMDQVRELGADVILGNTYHLMLRPGAERVARLGGLHHFARWPHPILTDSVASR